MGIKIHKRQKDILPGFALDSNERKLQNQHLNTEAKLSLTFISLTLSLICGMLELENWKSDSMSDSKPLIVIRCESEGVSLLYFLSWNFKWNIWHKWVESLYVKTQMSFLSEKTMKSNLLIKWR